MAALSSAAFAATAQDYELRDGPHKLAAESLTRVPNLRLLKADFGAGGAARTVVENLAEIAPKLDKGFNPRFLRRKASGLSLKSTPDENDPFKGETERLLNEWHTGARDYPVKVSHPPLPADATEKDLRVAELFLLIRSLREEELDDRPVPFGKEWVAEQVQLPETTTWRAIQRLKEWKFFHVAQKLYRPGKRPLYCYALGPKPTPDRSKQAAIYEDDGMPF